MEAMNARRTLRQQLHVANNLMETAQALGGSLANWVAVKEVNLNDHYMDI